MQDDRVRVTVDERGIAEVVMVRATKMNALDRAMFQGLVDAIDAVRRNGAIRVVVLHGEGRAFCAGLDTSRIEGMEKGTAELKDLLTRTHGVANASQQVAWGWRELPVPVIAAVHGVAYGGGLQIALGADMRLVRPDAKLSVREIHWGLVPDMAGCVLLSELLRPDQVRELTYTGRIVGGSEAVALGMATRVCENPLAEARAMAAEIAGRNPDAVKAAKRILNGASPIDARAVLLAESHEQLRLIGSPNQVEAVRAGMSGRPAEFR